MKLKIKGEVEEKVLEVSLEVNDLGGIFVLYNDIRVGYIEKRNGEIVSYGTNHNERATLERLGVEFNDGNFIKTS